MRPYRHRALPRRRNPPPVEVQTPSEPVSAEPYPQPDAPSPTNMNNLMQMLSMIQSSFNTGGMQALLPYLSSQFRSFSEPLSETGKDAGQTSESERIRAIIASHENRSSAPNKSAFEATADSLPNEHSEQFDRATSAVENMQRMREAVFTLSRDPASFVSKQLGSRIKERTRDQEHLVEMIMNRRELTPESLMPLILKNSRNPLVSAMMQNSRNSSEEPEHRDRP